MMDAKQALQILEAIRSDKFEVLKEAKLTLELMELKEAIARCGLIKCYCSVCEKLCICRPDRRNYPCSTDCAIERANNEQSDI